MKAMTLNAYGETATFEAAELANPAAKPGHVVVQVAATSVNTVDTMIRNMGTDLPFAPAFPAVLGMDFAGTITEIGEGVSGFAVGDEVYGCAERSRRSAGCACSIHGRRSAPYREEAEIPVDARSRSHPAGRHHCL